MTTKRVRRAGAQWRLLAWADAGRTKVELNSDDRPAIFDEVCVDRWLHVEQKDTGAWWMNVGGVTLWVQVDRDGRPKKVTVYDPDRPEPGCSYDLPWNDGTDATQRQDVSHLRAERDDPGYHA